MVRTTRKQREALFRVFQRDFPSWVSPGKRHAIGQETAYYDYVRTPTNQWRRFRKQVQPYMDSSGCIMIHWRGMWLGIETDGHTHS